MSGQYNFRLERGVTFNFSITYKNDVGVAQNISTWEPRIRLIAAAQGYDEIIDDVFVTTALNVGRLDVSFDPIFTEALVYDRYFYALEFVKPDDSVIRLLYGHWAVGL